MADCFDCGGIADHEHHVVPVSLGGTRTVPLCIACHGKSHAAGWTISSLTASAMAAKKARGEYTGGHAPYGWLVASDGVTLARCEDEQAVIESACALRLSGMSLRKIGAALSMSGRNPRSGGGWAATQVARMVSRG